MKQLIRSMKRFWSVALLALLSTGHVFAQATTVTQSKDNNCFENGEIVPCPSDGGGLVFGLIIGVILLIFLAVAAFFIIKKRKGSINKNSNLMTGAPPINQPLGLGPQPSSPPIAPMTPTVADPSMSPLPSNPITEPLPPLAPGLEPTMPAGSLPQVSAPTVVTPANPVYPAQPANIVSNDQFPGVTQEPVAGAVAPVTDNLVSPPSLSPPPYEPTPVSPIAPTEQYDNPASAATLPQNNLSAQPVDSPMPIVEPVVAQSDPNMLVATPPQQIAPVPVPTPPSIPAISSPPEPVLDSSYQALVSTDQVATDLPPLAPAPFNPAQEPNPVPAQVDPAFTAVPNPAPSLDETPIAPIPQPPQQLQSSQVPQVPNENQPPQPPAAPPPLT